MGAIANGLAYHGGLIPFVGTFLVFSDYMRGAVRLAALSRLRVVYVWTHDSVGVGEDGPTHEPIEHVAALRAVPNLHVIRPGDPNEAVAAWRVGDRAAGRPHSAHPEPPEAAGGPGEPGGGARGRAAGRIRPGRCRGPGRLPRRPGGHPHRDRLGTPARRGCARRPPGRRNPDARRVPPLLGAVRRAASPGPRRRSAAGGHQAGEHRGRRLAGLGPLGRPRWRDHGDRHVRPVGARTGGHGGVRLHRGPGRRVANGVLEGTILGVVANDPHLEEQR